MQIPTATTLETTVQFPLNIMQMFSSSSSSSLYLYIYIYIFLFFLGFFLVCVLTPLNFKKKEKESIVASIDS